MHSMFSNAVDFVQDLSSWDFRAFFAQEAAYCHELNDCEEYSHYGCYYCTSNDFYNLKNRHVADVFSGADAFNAKICDRSRRRFRELCKRLLRHASNFRVFNQRHVETLVMLLPYRHMVQ